MKNKRLENIDLSLNLSRYTFLRYMTSIEFFMFLYWLISSLLSRAYLQMIYPITLAFIMLWLNKDIFLLIKGNKKTNMKKVVKLLHLSIIILCTSLILTFINHKLIFPFINTQSFVYIYIMISISIIGLSINNAIKIRDDKDKVYRRYEEYKNRNKKTERINYV